MNIGRLYEYHTLNVDSHTRLALPVQHHATILALSLTQVLASHCYLLAVNTLTIVSCEELRGKKLSIIAILIV